MPVVKINEDVELHYNEFGTGDNYLLCAAQFISSIDDYSIELAERGFHVYNITIRGYGQSTHVFEDYGLNWYDIWAKDVCDFATVMGIDQFCYSGVSHGAGIGWTICVNHPERLKGFFGVVAGPHSKDGKDTGEARMRTIKAAETPEAWKAYCDKLTKSIAYKIRGDETQEELERIRAAEEEHKAFWYGMKKEEIVINPRKPFPHIKTEEELIEVLSKIEIPTLLLGGMHDDISLPSNLVRSCNAVKDSKLVLYESATHGLSVEHKKDICDDIMVFCEQRNLI